MDKPNKQLFTYKTAGFNFVFHQVVEGTKCISRITTCVITDLETGRTANFSVSCHYKDRYTRKEGRKHALAKAITLLDRAERTLVWAEYFKVVKK